jgi:sodium-dependent phosphate cotransporter
VSTKETWPVSDLFERMTTKKRLELTLRILSAVFLLYLFLIGVSCLSGGLKMMGDGFARSLFNVTANPFSALMAGMLATVLFQSSSVTTSIIVGLVSAGTISIGGAVPMIMGANLGTSVTNSLVSLGYAKNKENFKRAFAAATVHDFFNILSVVVLLPLEITFGFIETLSTSLAKVLFGSSVGGSFSSPIKAAIKPVVGSLQSFSLDSFGETSAGIAMIVLAALIIVSALSMIVKVMGSIVAEQEGHILDKIFAKNAYMAMVFGIVSTIAAQSSSITTALLIPLAGSGLLTVTSVYPVTVGANIGTTATALLAALTGNMAGLAIALVHLVFNLLGTLLFFVVPLTRQLPIACAEVLAGSIDRTKMIGFGYVATVFFILPISLIYLS